MKETDNSGDNSGERLVHEKIIIFRDWVKWTRGIINHVLRIQHAHRA